jgi:hypothetical protein
LTEAPDDGNNAPFDKDTIQFEQATINNSNTPRTMGVFAKKEIAANTVIATIPFDAPLEMSHPIIQSSKAVQLLIDEAMASYVAFVDKKAEQIGPYDRFHANKGRMFGEETFRTMILVTLMLYTRENLLNKSSGAHTRRLAFFSPDEMSFVSLSYYKCGPISHIQPYIICINTAKLYLGLASYSL